MYPSMQRDHHRPDIIIGWKHKWCTLACHFIRPIYLYVYTLRLRLFFHTHHIMTILLMDCFPALKEHGQFFMSSNNIRNHLISESVLLNSHHLNNVWSQVGLICTWTLGSSLQQCTYTAGLPDKWMKAYLISQHNDHQDGTLLSNNNSMSSTFTNRLYWAQSPKAIWASSLRGQCESVLTGGVHKANLLN